LGRRLKIEGKEKKTWEDKKRKIVEIDI